jgi:hypothetical protein
MIPYRTWREDSHCPHHEEGELKLTLSMVHRKTVERFTKLVDALSRETELMIMDRAIDARDLVAILSHSATIAVRAANSIADIEGQESLAVEAVAQAAVACDTATRMVHLLADAYIDQSESVLHSIEKMAARVEGCSLLLGLAREEVRGRRRDAAMSVAATDQQVDAHIDESLGC